jgi:hypothetical protein
MFTTLISPLWHTVEIVSDKRSTEEPLTVLSVKPYLLLVGIVHTVEGLQVFHSLLGMKSAIILKRNRMLTFTEWLFWGIFVSLIFVILLIVGIIIFESTASKKETVGLKPMILLCNRGECVEMEVKK